MLTSTTQPSCLLLLRLARIQTCRLNYANKICPSLTNPTTLHSIIHWECWSAVSYFLYRDKNVFNQKECLYIVGSSRSIVVGVFRRESFLLFRRRVSLSLALEPQMKHQNPTVNFLRHLPVPSLLSIGKWMRRTDEKNYEIMAMIIIWNWPTFLCAICHFVPANSDKQKMMRCTSFHSFFSFAIFIRVMVINLSTKLSSILFRYFSFLN